MKTERENVRNPHELHHTSEMLRWCVQPSGKDTLGYCYGGTVEYRAFVLGQLARVGVKGGPWPQIETRADKSGCG
jgi:hypothetical protein